MYPWLVLLATTALVHALLGAVSFMLIALLVKGNLSLSATRTILLLLKAGTSFLTAWWAFSLNLFQPLAWVAVMVVTIGAELNAHVGKRTTAAYSTSDGQNQRLFNLSCFIMAVSACFALGLYAILGKNFSFSNSWFFSSQSNPVLKSVLLVPGLALFLRSLVLSFQHRRTLGYLVRNYWSAIKERKLKRYW